MPRVNVFQVHNGLLSAESSPGEQTGEVRRTNREDEFVSREEFGATAQRHIRQIVFLAQVLGRGEEDGMVVIPLQAKVF